MERDVPAEEQLSEAEVFSAIASAFSAQESGKIKALAGELLEAVEARRPFDPQAWCELWNAVHVARRDEGVVPEWSDGHYGALVHLRLINEAARARNPR